MSFFWDTSCPGFISGKQSLHFKVKMNLQRWCFIIKIRQPWWRMRFTNATLCNISWRMRPGKTLSSTWPFVFQLREDNKNGWDLFSRKITKAYFNVTCALSSDVLGLRWVVLNAALMFKLFHLEPRALLTFQRSHVFALVQISPAFAIYMTNVFQCTQQISWTLKGL